MHCVSTRGGARVPLVEAIALGMAPDGGLYVPEVIPRHVTLSPGSLVDVARALLGPFFAGETLAPALDAICAGAFTFDAPVVALEGEDLLLELFHGPTAAFKDFGARFLAECLARDGATSERTILVATSGDTGAAVAAAFADRPGFRVVVLYPDGRVSGRQAHQLGAFGPSVRAFAVAGSFDDCQRLAKQAFADEALRGHVALRSANSISLGRLLPQMAYYAKASLDRPGVGFVVPTGNLGNAVACVLTRAMGLPIGKIVLATNANRVLVDWVRGGPYTPQASVGTLANAMDVGAPSNAERLGYLFPDPASLARAVSADSVDDETIRRTITRTFRATGHALCPHTACGVEVLRRLRAHGERGPFIVAATAHAAKFETIVEPLIGAAVAAPAPLAALLARPSHMEHIPARYEALEAILRTR